MMKFISSNAIGHGKQGYEKYKKQILDLPNQYLKPKLLSKNN